MTGATAPRLMAADRIGASSSANTVTLDDDRRADDADGLCASQPQLHEDALPAVHSWPGMRCASASHRPACPPGESRMLNSWMGMTRVRRDSALCTVIVASSAVSGTMESLAGLAVMMLPATVARLRICGAPTSQHARASGNARCSTTSRIARALVVRHQRSQMDVRTVEGNIRHPRYTRQVDERQLLAIRARACHAPVSISRSVPPAMKRPHDHRSAPLWPVLRPK